MKKLAILVMAMVLVVGMSLGVLADMPDSEDVDVEITFLENAILEVGGPIQFDAVPPSDDGAGQGDWIDDHSKHGGTADFRVESNTDFKVTIEENVTTKIINEFDGIGYTDVVTDGWDEWYGAGEGGSAWIYFNIELVDTDDIYSVDHLFDVTSNPESYSFMADQGIVDTELQANININGDAPRSDNWTNLTAGETVNGQLTVTVEAQ